jgi:hypothetical protein
MQKRNIGLQAAGGPEHLGAEEPAMRTAVCASALALSVIAAESRASFHLMQIEQLIGGVGGNAAAQAIQLRMRSSFQNQMSFTRIVAYNASGGSPVVLVDMDQPVAGFNLGARVLIATPSFLGQTTPTTTADFIMAPIPASYLNGGKVTFEDDFGTIYWSVAFGAYGGPNTGDFTNDLDGDFGPPFGGPLPSAGVQALRFQGSATAPSTTNAADYALTSGAATWTNNAGQSFMLSEPPPPCGSPDFDCDGDVGTDADIESFFACLAGTCPAQPCTSTADFNGDGDVGTDADIEAFFRVLAGGQC